ncbi:porin family protein [uncultured Muribaculum sp.]|uniref:porin family protein n=1 Tax=uncultured Muribaculum sp. TaxID=1918613 RepID=UPI0025EB0DC6|nr:porin family protein [uncultured Muribaculum sp.]
MKKFFVAAMAAISATGMWAQRASDSSEFSFWDNEAADQKIVIGPRVGLNISTFSLDKIDDSDLSSKVGFSAGVAVEFPIVRSFYINTGLFYTTKGAKEEVTEGRYTEKVTMNAGYLEIPLYASYRLNFAEESQLQVNFGPYFAYGVNGKLKYEDNEDEYDMDLFGVADNDDEEGKAGFKRFDFGLGVGLGYTFQRIYLGMNYQFGLVNIADKKVWENGSIKNSNFNISLGYNF